MAKVRKVKFDEPFITDRGKKIKYLRMLVKWNQQELADKTGIDRSLIANYESNRTEPREAPLRKIADAFNVPISVFFRPLDTRWDLKDIQSLEENPWESRGEFKTHFAEWLAGNDELDLKIPKDLGKLLESYEALNDEGKKKTLEYMKDIYLKYKK